MSVRRGAACCADGVERTCHLFELCEQPIAPASERQRLTAQLGRVERSCEAASWTSENKPREARERKRMLTGGE